MSNFRPVDRETGFLLPPSVEEWLPERHLARFVVEVIEQLDLSAFVKAYRGSGSASYHPSMLLGLLVYGYATGVFSSRKLERATYDSVAFRFIAANDHPDHEPAASGGARPDGQWSGRALVGTVALDGTARQREPARRTLRRIGGGVDGVGAADGADVPDGMSVPEELARREDRLARRRGQGGDRGAGARTP